MTPICSGQFRIGREKQMGKAITDSQNYKPIKEAAWEIEYFKTQIQKALKGLYEHDR